MTTTTRAPSIASRTDGRHQRRRHPRGVTACDDTRRRMLCRATATLARAPSTRARARRRAATRAASGAFDVYVFDLDGVLYDGANGYLAHVRERQRVYLMETHGMTREEAFTTRERAFAKASQCYKGFVDMGLIHARQMSQEEFTAYCRDGVESFLRADEALERCVREMGGERGDVTKKIVMTNTSETEGMKALAALGLTARGESPAVFDDVYGGLFMSPYCKPQREAYERVLEEVGAVDMTRAVLFEESLKNLKTAKALGMRTVFVRTSGEYEPSEREREEFLDAVVDSMDDHQLRAQMPELFV